MDINFFLQQIREISDHEPLGSCSFGHMELISEQQKGAISILTFKCRMCHIVKKLSTVEDSASGLSEPEVTKSLVFGAITIGCGYSQLQQLLGILDIPGISQRKYQKCQEEVSQKILDTAMESMDAAAKEEAELARDLGEIDKNGYPLISVIADGAWSKRSYKTDYSALSGVVRNRIVF